MLPNSKIRKLIVLGFIVLFAIVSYIIYRGSYLEYKELVSNTILEAMDYKYWYLFKEINYKIHQTRLENIMDYEFFKENPRLHYVDLTLQCQSRQTLLQDVVNHLSLLKINCNSCSISTNSQNQTSIVHLCIEVYDLDHLNTVINSLSSSLQGVYDVYRSHKN